MKYTRRYNCWGQQQHFEYKSWACHISIKAGFSTTSLNFHLIIVINWNEVSTFSGMMNNTTWEHCFRAFIQIITLQDFTHRLDTWTHLVLCKGKCYLHEKVVTEYWGNIFFIWSWTSNEIMFANYCTGYNVKSTDKGY